MWTRRWIAASGGVLVNGLILGALVLIEEPAPILEDPPVIVVELERPQRRASAQRQASASARSASPVHATAAQLAVSEGEGAPAAAAASEAPSAPDVDPQWRIEQKTIDRWKLTEGVPAAGWGRYHRACAGLSSEHMTPDEKERCYDGWKDRPATKRPSPNFVGPIDERHWEVPEPKAPSRFDKDEVRKQKCRAYRGGRTPGFSERNFSTGSPPPSLREGGCF